MNPPTTHSGKIRTHLAKIGHLAATVTVFAILSAATAISQQSGEVGGLAASYSLEWGRDGSLSGTYYYPSEPGKVFRVSGRLLPGGSLYLEEFTGNALSARCELTRTGSTSTWTGFMNNTDGKRFRMSIAGLISPPASEPPARVSSPSGGSTYTGEVGGLGAVYSLTWHDDGSVTGSYHYPARSGTVYTLKGNNRTKGKLYLEEFTNGTLSARCSLAKSITNNRIVWSGVMKNTDGRQFQMSLSRDRDLSPTISASAPPSGPKSDSNSLSASSRSKFDSVSRFSAFAGALSKYHDCEPYRAEVIRIDTDEIGSRVVFRAHQGPLIGPRAFSIAPFEATLDWKKELGPAPFAPGVLAQVEIDGNQTIQSAAVWILPLKWRQTANGEVEFLLSSVSHDDRQGPSFVLRPIRWAEFHPNDYFIAVKDVGAVLATYEAGAGALELETVSLDTPSTDSIPWIPFAERKPTVPTSQYIDDRSY
jgi:hypothetical protein